MADLKNLLIVERSSGSLSIAGESKDYVLEGIFGEIDSKNKNNRIYTEGEYVPQIEALQNKIKSSKLLGELDHPQQFDISLKNVSHIIEDLHYDKDSKHVKGRIRLLDTDAGRQAKALVDAGVPLQISSRAAGTVESSGKVKIKQLFTYDLVADPGFENAELSRVNESYGFSNDSNLFIYEVGNEPQVLETTNSNQNNTEKMEEFVNTNDFNKYTEYLAEEIKTLKNSIDEVKTNVSESANKTVEQQVQDVIAHNDHLVENINKVSEYTQYLAEQLDKNIQYTEYVAEQADNGIQYAEHVAEKLDQSIQYSEHIAEKTDQNILYTENVSEKLEDSVKYTETVAESVNKLKEYANYIAESSNEGFTENDKLVEYVDYLKENLESVTEYAQYIAESINENLVTEEEGTEAGKDIDELDDDTIGDNSKEGEVSADAEETGVEAEDLEADLKDSEAEIEAKSKEGEDPSKEDVGEEGVHDPLESYKKEISSKLDTLVEKALVKENENPSFFRIVSGSTQSKYNELNEDAKKEVRQAVSKRGFMTESNIISLIESSQLIVENKNAEPFVLQSMPSEYKEQWEALSESKQAQILAQSKYFTLNTEYQVSNFWQTRDLRESKSVMQKLEMVNENKEVQEETKPMYDVSTYADELKKRFKK
jgi:methyl-accepting chemotaxis protein